MNAESLKEAIRRELPALLREDADLRGFIQDLMRGQFADRLETQDRFEKLLGELRRDREANERKWEAQEQKWEEQQTVLRDHMAEQSRLWKESSAEQERRWYQNKRQFDAVHEAIMAQAKKHDRSIGALGSRWGTQSEATFRNALAGILEQSFGVTVMRVDEYDDAGTVFGRPDQVELDIIIKNGLLLICELKSSIDKAGMYIFERKARYYEQRHGQKANRLIVISPMIDPRAQQVADQLGIETFSDSLDVATL
ncbi:DUF3782 domain-containing protein [uncultured Thiodictyon sp.]|jgi:hypothetical protein|uniref:PD-(D/E)XK nuclease family protein n=1 Tax=uncultured Thiodictyon sp. TaxID=1846217 RepID=UPI0025CC7CA2|nr:DUF3782 domain-containing protein [uncultured Thiodictyon sp.]